MKQFHAILTLALIIFALGVSFYLIVIKLPKIQCTPILSDGYIESFAWGKDSSSIYSLNKRQISKNVIENCSMKTKAKFPLKDNYSQVLICQRSDRALLKDKSNKFWLLDIKNSNLKLISDSNDFEAIYCNSNYIVWRQSSEEFSNAIKVTDVKNKFLYKSSNDELIYTLIPLDQTNTITYKEDLTNPGLYKGKDLLLPASKFSQWDISDNNLYYTQPDRETTILKSQTTDSHKQISSQRIDYVITNEIKISPDERLLATKTLLGKLILFQIKK